MAPRVGIRIHMDIVPFETAHKHNLPIAAVNAEAPLTRSSSPGQDIVGAQNCIITIMQVDVTYDTKIDRKKFARKRR